MRAVYDGKEGRYEVLEGLTGYVGKDLDDALDVLRYSDAGTREKIGDGLAKRMELAGRRVRTLENKVGSLGFGILELKNKCTAKIGKIRDCEEMVSLLEAKYHAEIGKIDERISENEREIARLERSEDERLFLAEQEKCKGGEIDRPRCFGAGTDLLVGTRTFGKGFLEVAVGESDKVSYITKISESPFFTKMTGEEKRREIDGIIGDEGADDGSKGFRIVKLIVNAMRDEWFMGVVGNSLESRNKHYFCNRYVGTKRLRNI